MTVDLDEMIESLRRMAGDPNADLCTPACPNGQHVHEVPWQATVADALESTLAELRQQRERADKYRERAKKVGRKWALAVDDLSRAEETIEQAIAHEWSSYGKSETWRILTEYGNQKGAGSGSPSGGPEPLEGT